MRFLSRKRQQLEDRGIDVTRLPPGQYLTERFPVLHAGVVPEIDVAEWDFTVEGLVDRPQRWTYPEILAMPATTQVCDIHCVTKWSKLDTEWEGVRVTDLMASVTVLPEASHVLVLAEHGFTANLPVADFLRPENLFAYRYGGADLEPDHGWPLRLVVPHLYFWKSVKWVRGLRFLDRDEPGFWERNGYHMYGDPWQQQRYWGD